MSPQGWHEDFPDPCDFLEPRFGSKAIGDEDGLNSAYYANPRVDALLERAKHALDGAERTRLYAEAERIVCDEAPWAFESSFRSYHVRQPYVRGYRMHAVWLTDVTPMWLDRAANVHALRDAPLARELLGALTEHRP